MNLLEASPPLALMCAVMTFLTVWLDAGATSQRSRRRAPPLCNAGPFPSSDICFSLQWGGRDPLVVTSQRANADWGLTKTCNWYNVRQRAFGFPCDDESPSTDTGAHQAGFYLLCQGKSKVTNGTQLLFSLILTRGTAPRWSVLCLLKGLSITLSGKAQQLPYNLLFLLKSSARTGGLSVLIAERTCYRRRARARPCNHRSLNHTILCLRRCWLRNWRHLF